MNIKELRLLFLSIYIIVIIGIFFPLLTPLIEDEQSEFISMTILGEGGKTSNYFTEENSLVHLGDENIWIIRIDNEIKELSYIMVKVKMADPDDTMPDNTECTPSNAETIYQLKRVLVYSEKIEIPFKWMIQEVDDENKISSIRINDSIRQINVKLGEELNGKIIFELWKYNVDNDQFEFNNKYGKRDVCIWNQVNFKMELN